MIDTIYIEEEVSNHPRTKEILRRFPKAVRIPCERYGEVFNPKSQNFRLQKKNPALILAKKFKHFVLEAPPGYGIGSENNFYFSHMLNCIYDCRYCFLQGMFRSAHLVCFVNFEDFEQAISETIEKHEDAHFFSGYDCDSLALDSVTHFARSILDFFGSYPKALIELRTKSVQIQSLLDREVIPNCVVAFSLTPDEIAKELEHGAPPVSRRLGAMAKLQECGWKVGLRFDPIIYTKDYLNQYQNLFLEAFKLVKIQQLHSVTLGPFRLPKEMYERMYRLYPGERLFAAANSENNNLVSYKVELEHEMIESVTQELLQYIPKQIYFPAKLKAHANGTH